MKARKELIRKIKTEIKNRVDSFDRKSEFFFTTLYEVGVLEVDKESKKEDYLKKSLFASKHGKPLCFYNSFLDNDFMIMNVITNQLKNSMQENELNLYYQPIIDSITKKVIKVESLLRWNHPKYGMLNPEAIISIAEKTGLILKLGDWIFKKSVTDMKEWNCCKSDLISVSINTSPMQYLKTDSYMPLWNDFLLKVSVNPSYICLEITESIFMDFSYDKLSIINSLSKRGFKIALDDFGTKYSTFSYLSKIPIDIIKIDKVFVSNIEDSISNMSIIEAIVNVSKRNGYDIVAEGVENIEQLKKLNDLGVNVIQGYYYSKPLPKSELITFLNKCDNDE